jgi:hypothetical protein
MLKRQHSPLPRASVTPPIPSDNEDISVLKPKKSRHTQSESSGSPSSTTEGSFSIQVHVTISSQLLFLKNPIFQPEDEQRMKEESWEVKVKLLESHVRNLEWRIIYMSKKVKHLEEERKDLEDILVYQEGPIVEMKEKVERLDGMNKQMWRLWKECHPEIDLEQP